jgi:ribonuclease VapC
MTSNAFVPWNGQRMLVVEVKTKTRQFGLSLGDRACLALGLSQKLSVLTTDRAWLFVDIEIPVKLIR